jgi:5'-3' exonuclease
MKRIFTGSMYGVISQVGQLMLRYNCPVYIAIEPKNNRKRYALKPDYKGNRDRNDPELPIIFELYYDTLNALSLYRDVHIISAPDVCDGEADDVIYSFLMDWHLIYDKFLVFSNDKDLMQAAKEPQLKGKIVYASIGDPQEVPFETRCEKEFGISPDSLLLYRSIIGDSSDNLKAPCPRFSRDLARSIVGAAATPEEIWSKAIKEIALDKKSDREWIEKLAGQKKKLEINFEVMKLQYILTEKRDFKRPDRNVGYYWIEYGMSEFMKLYEVRNGKKPEVRFA